MFTQRVLVRYVILIPILVLVIIYFLAFHNTEANTEVVEKVVYEAPIYSINLTESTQHDICEMCEKNKLSYELILSICQIEGINNTQKQDIEVLVEDLVYYRDYWTDLGYPDEIVFDLMLLSRQRGIEGCAAYIQDNGFYEINTYVKSITEYKFYLEQNLKALTVANQK